MPDTDTPWNDAHFAAAWNQAYGLDMSRAPTRAGLIYPWLAERIGAFEGLALADFGCGNGNLIAHFQDRPFAHWNGYDSGAAILETAQHIKDPRIALHVAALDEPGPALEKADVVTGIFVIEEIPAANLAAFFRNVADTLMPGGRAFFVTNHPAYAMAEAHANPGAKFSGHRGYFDTDASTYALSLLNQRDGHKTMAAYHHKPMGLIFNTMTSCGLRLDEMLETPGGVIDWTALRARQPQPGDVPRFLFLSAVLR